MYKIRVFVFLFVLIFACTKTQELEDSSIYASWEISDFVSVESVYYAKPENRKVLITFKPDGTYRLQLDVNSCFGNFSVSEPDSISIETPGCTKMCCDSEFAQKAVQKLAGVNRFSFENNKLKLHVPQWGWLVLVLQ